MFVHLDHSSAAGVLALGDRKKKKERVLLGNWGVWGVAGGGIDGDEDSRVRSSFMQVTIPSERLLLAWECSKRSLSVVKALPPLFVLFLWSMVFMVMELHWDHNPIDLQCDALDEVKADENHISK